MNPSGKPPEDGYLTPSINTVVKLHQHRKSAVDFN
jgi:hypothetical protein